MYCRPHSVCALIALALLVVAPGVLSAETYTVVPDGKTGFPTIQAAVDATRDGDVVVLEAGTYTGSGNRDVDLRGKAITIRSADPENPDVVQATVLDCQGNEKSPHRGFYVVNANGATLAGLAITNGVAEVGGAVYCANSDLTLSHCRIVGNAALSGGDGGGVYAINSVLYVSDCTVTDNTAGPGGDSEFAPARGGHGGGIYADSLLVTESTIADNAAGKGGAGIQGAEGGHGGGIYGGRMTIENCTIEGNAAGAGGDSTNGEKGIAGKGGDGGGIFCSDSLQITGSLVAGNRCGNLGSGLSASLVGMNATGGGIWCSTGVIDHCTIVSNAAGEQTWAVINDTKYSASSGGGLICSGQANVTNSIVWGNTPDELVGVDCASVAYSDIESSDCPADQGNISVDPAFVETGHWADPADPAAVVTAADPGAVWVAGDYRLTADSPCVDAGDPDYADDPNAVDLNGAARLAGKATDMGAYELESLVPVYRLWSSVTGKHFFTIDEAERAALLQQPNVWTSEGVAYLAYASATEANLMPVYRFWSEKLSAHFWTINEAEKDYLIAVYADAWTYEGPAFYAYPEGSQPVEAKPVYRFWSSMTNAHFYTIDEAEKDYLIRESGDVWAFESVAWYALESESDDGGEEPVTEEGEYEFTCDRGAASYGFELTAIFDGWEVQIDNPIVELSSATGRMTMAVDFGGMTTDLEEFQVTTDLAQHSATVTDGTAGGAEFPLTLMVLGVFDTETPRGPFVIDAQTLAFSNLVGGQIAIDDEMFQIVGSAVLEGQKYDVDLMLAPTDFEADGSATFDDSGYPDRLDANMDGPFQWRRQGQGDLLLEANLKGHVLQIYVTSVYVRGTGLWLGKNLAGGAKTTK